MGWKDAPLVEQDSQTPAWASAPLVDDVGDKPTKKEDAVSGYAKFIKGVGKGLRDPIDGLSQLATHALPSGIVDAGNNLNNWLVDRGVPLARLEGSGAAAEDKLVKDNAAAYAASRGDSKGMDWGRLLGNVANPVNFAVPGGASSNLAGAVGRGIAGGAVASAAQPVEDAKDGFWQAKGKQAATGAAAGGLFNGVLHSATRLVSPTARMLHDSGVRMTPGQLIGGVAQEAEDSVRSLPLVGDAIKHAQRTALRDFSDTAVNRSLGEIGDALPNGVHGHDAIAYAANRLSSAYDDLLPRLTVRADPQFANDMQALNGMARHLPGDRFGQYRRIVQQQIFDRFSPAGHMTPQGMKEAERELGRMATRYLKDPSVDAQDLGDALREVQGSLRSLVERGNPNFRGQLQAINRGWANFIRVQKAAASTGARDGIFTPAQLHAAVKATDMSRNKRLFARGDALMQDLSMAGKDVLSQTVPDSGTPQRLFYGVGLLGGANMVAPGSALLGGGVAAAYYSPQAQAALRQAILATPGAARALEAARLPQAAGALTGAMQR